MTIINPYGFIYITTNLKNGKRYIGKKVFDKKNEWKSYLGSGVALKNAIQKYGKENFKKNIVAFAYSENELCELEKQIISLFNASDSLDFYNIALGGEGYNFFGTEKGDHSIPVYCIELDRAFKNSRIAEEVTGENMYTIRTRCKTFKNNVNIKKGYRWCYISDMYSILKCCSSSIPVVLLDNNKVYGSWNHAKKVLNIPFTRRSVITFEQYCYKIKNGKSIKNKFLRLEDYLKIKEFTE